MAHRWEWRGQALLAVRRADKNQPGSMCLTASRRGAESRSGRHTTDTRSSLCYVLPPPRHGRCRPNRRALHPTPPAGTRADTGSESNVHERESTPTLRSSSACRNLSQTSGQALPRPCPGRIRHTSVHGKIHFGSDQISGRSLPPVRLV